MPGSSFLRWLGEINWRQLVFSFRGRIDRAQYALVLPLAVMAILLPVLLVAITARSDPETAIELAIPLIGLFELACFYAFFAMTAKRLHDRNRSARWLYLLAAPLSVLRLLLFLPQKMIGPSPDSLIPWLYVPVAVLWFAELVCRAGTRGANRYGDPPMNRANTAAVFE